MANDIQNVAERLEKLLLMLSSDKDGEVVCAARAVERTLNSVGADWHDLVAALLKPAAPTNRFGEWQMMREYCAQHPTQLHSREREFVADLAHWRGALTEKQMSWLASIHARLKRAA